MNTAIVTAAVAFAVSALLTPLVRSRAIGHGAVDRAVNSRKQHQRPVPRVGGIAIAIAFYIAVGVALSWPSLTSVRSGESGRTELAVLLGGVVIVVLGAYDDLRGASARQKFAVQFGVAAMLYAFGLRIESFENPFGNEVALTTLSIPVTLLWVTGVVNAMNLIDGLDGLASGIAIAAALMTAAVAASGGDTFAVLSAAAVAGAASGFVLYNFHPATIFMGDSGSMFLGYVLATSAIHQPARSHGSAHLLAFVVALGIPLADTVSAIVRRWIRGSPVFAADREHIHHRLLELGLGPRKVLLILWSLALFLAGAGMTLAGCSRGALLVALAVAGPLALDQLGCLRLSQDISALLARRRANLARRRAVTSAANRLRQSTTLGDVSEALRNIAPAFDARSISFADADGRAEHGPSLSARVRDPVTDEGVFYTRHALGRERNGVGAIEVAWPAGCSAPDRDTEIALEMLCEHVTSALRHVERNALQTSVPARGSALAVAARRTASEHGNVSSYGDQGELWQGGQSNTNPHVGQ